jgi:hypothetical protein
MPKTKTKKAQKFDPKNSKRRNLIISVVAGVLVLIAGYTIAFSSAANCAVSSTLVNPCRPWLGAAANKYPGIADGDYKSQIEAHEKAIGKQVDIAHTYHSVGSNELSTGDKYFASRANTYLFTNWKPADKWATANGSNSSINAGIDKMAASIKSLGSKKIFLTINHEPENDVSGGGQGCSVTYRGSAGTPADYKAMWANVRKRFDAAGVTNVVWVMDYMNYSPWDCLVDDLYPGNNLVDWVMFNAYGYGTGSTSDATANVKRFIDLMAKYQDGAHNFSSKPWGIVEWNVHGMPAATAYKYYDDIKAIANNNTFPNIKAYMVFDSIGPEGNDNRIAYVKPGSAAAQYDATKLSHYKQLATSAAFASGPAVTPTPAPSQPGTSPAPQPGGGSGTPAVQHGLTGAYFGNRNLGGSAKQRTDSTMAFDWGSGSPLFGIPADNFSVRWTGSVVPTTSAKYTFYTQADDGVRLWVNDKKIIDDWNTHGTKERYGAIDLKKGNQYSIKLEYFEANGLSDVKLLWSSSDNKKQVVPTSQLLAN